MFTPMFTRKLQSEMQAAVNEVLVRNGVMIKDHAPLDLRRSRDNTFGRVMKFDLIPSAGQVPLMNLKSAKPKLNKNASLDTAMKAFGVKNKTNAKGDTLVSFHRNRPKYPFVYVSIRGARWKASADMAKRRFA